MFVTVKIVLAVISETLWIDIDDTLILFDPLSISSRYMDQWEPNCVVIQFVNKFVQVPNKFRRVVYWSSGGKEYTESVVEEIRQMNIELPKGPCIAKYSQAPTIGDLFLDDEPFLSYTTATVHPKELVFAPAFAQWLAHGYNGLEYLM